MVTNPSDDNLELIGDQTPDTTGDILPEGPTDAGQKGGQTIRQVPDEDGPVSLVDYLWQNRED